MTKTITIRIDDDIYEMFKNAAERSGKSLSNFIEFATLSYLTNKIHVTDEEMNEILSNNSLLKSLNKGLDDVKKENYEIVP